MTVLWEPRGRNGCEAAALPGCYFLSLPPEPSDQFPQTALSHKQQNLLMGKRAESHHRRQRAAHYFSMRGCSDVTVHKSISPSLHRLGAVSVRAHPPPLYGGAWWRARRRARDSGLVPGPGLGCTLGSSAALRATGVRERARVVYCAVSQVIKRRRRHQKG